MKTWLIALLCYIIGIGPAFGTTYYVSKSTDNSELGYVIGNNGNSGLSPSTSKLTPSSAISVAADGDTVIINNGTYSNAELGQSNNIIDLNGKALTLLPVVEYAVTFQTDSANNTVVLIRNGTATEVQLGALIIECEKPSTPDTYVNFGIQVNNSAVVDLAQYYQKTRVQNCANTNILDNATRGTARATDIQFAGRMNQGWATTAVVGSSGARKFFIDGLALQDITTINAASSRALLIMRDATTTNQVSVHIRRVIGTMTTPASSGANAVGVGIALVNITDALNMSDVLAPPLIEESAITLNGTSTSNECISISATSPIGQVARGDHPVMRRNTITFNCPAGRVFEIGSSTVANAVDDALVYENVVTIPYFATATPHGLSIGHVSGGEAYLNTFLGGYTPILLSENEGAYIHDNDLRGCYGRCLYTKGSGASIRPRIIRNTVVLTNEFGPARGGALAAASQNGTNNIDALFQENIVCAVSDLYRYVDVDVNQVGTFDTNTYVSYGPSGNTSPWFYQGVGYATLSAWQVAKETSANANRAYCDGRVYPPSPTHIQRLLNGSIAQ